LSQYLFTNVHQLRQAKYHLTKATSMVLGGGFHKIRSGDIHLFRDTGRAGVNSLPAPIDGVEEGERLNALWQVVIMNACWSSTDDSLESDISYDNPDSRIDAPWPVDSGSYSQVCSNIW
ncbi:hypothetical protein GYMLUDRAFT_104615, partial [Collybiopsis luxurians FD-317 M1]